MIIIPGIDCFDEETAIKNINLISSFSNFIHFDFADGIFTSVKTFGSPDFISNIKEKFRALDFEIHLMAENPEQIAESWLSVGIKRIIFHIETIKNPETLIYICKKYKVDCGVSILPTTPIDKIIPYLKYFDFIQILTVSPGFSGQKFGEDTMNRINFLKESAKNVRIEIDGGINLETAKLVKEAGVYSAISTSYILNSPNPKVAYDELMRV